MYGYSSSSISNSSGLNISYYWVSQGLPFKKEEDIFEKTTNKYFENNPLKRDI